MRRAIPSCRAALPLFLFLFFSFHIAAVGIGGIPNEAADPLSRSLRSAFWPALSPYILATAQWQNWGLFAPDPLREAVSFSVDEQRGGEWGERAVVAAGRMAPWRESSVIKMTESLYEGKKGSGVLRQSFLRSFCTERDRAEETVLRLRVAVQDVLGNDAGESTALVLSCSP